MTGRWQPDNLGYKIFAPNNAPEGMACRKIVHRNYGRDNGKPCGWWATEILQLQLKDSFSEVS